MNFESISHERLKRATVVLVGILLVFAILLGRIFWIQTVDFDKYLKKINRKGQQEEKNNRLKPQSISLYPDDVPVIRQLRRCIEDETDAMNVPVSAIYRAALHTAVLNPDKFVQLFKNLK